MKNRILAIIAFFTLLLGSSAVLETATPSVVSATPSSCTTSGQWYVGGTYAGYICFSGTGRYWLVGSCVNIFGFGAVNVGSGGKTVIGDWAWVRCPASYHFGSGLIKVYFGS